MVKITTKKGDEGKTTLRSGKKVSKDHYLVELIGGLDEIQSALGVAGNFCDCEEELITLEELLQNVMAHISKEEDIPEEFIKEVEKKISSLEKLPDPKAFLIPKGRSAFLHWARAVCRRVERRAVKTNFNNLKAFLNRLSDLLWLMAWREELKMNNYQIERDAK